MNIPNKIRGLFDKYDDLCRPVIFWNGIIHGLSVQAEEKPHRFGGPLPACEGIGAPDLHRLVITLDLAPIGLLLPTRKTPGQLPLIFRFDLNVLSNDYVIEGERLRFDHPKAMFGSWKRGKDSDLPYEPFPDPLPEINLGVDVRHELTFDDFQELCTSQGLEDSTGNRDISDHFFFILPVYKALGVPLWAAPDDPDAELAEGNLCVFDLDPQTGLVDASNQCS
ncbi:MAG: hypothetical protein AAGJ31_07045 [Verrucomicrobiota bacterium]